MCVLDRLLRQALGRLHVRAQQQILKDQLIQLLLAIEGLQMLSSQHWWLAVGPCSKGSLIGYLGLDDVLVEDVLRRALGDAGNIRQIVQACIRQLFLKLLKVAVQSLRACLAHIAKCLLLCQL